MYQKLLIVDDNWALAARIKKAVETLLPYTVEIADSFEKVEALVSDTSNEFYLAVLSLNLADIAGRDLIEYIAKKEIPVVAITERFEESIRDALVDCNMVDYLIKEDGRELDTVVDTLRRYFANARYVLLVADGDTARRQRLVGLLQRRNYQVLEAADGSVALQTVKANEDICLVLAHESLPKLNGFELTRKLRERFGKERLAIVGLTENQNSHHVAKMIKLGANDFLRMPFAVEELDCRITQNLDMLELVRSIIEASNVDPLTKVSSRRHFFSAGNRVYRRAKLEGMPLALALLDLDHFKHINDTYGPDVGDQALAQTGYLLSRQFRPTDLVARFSGQQFSVFMLSIQPKDAMRKMDHIRKSLENMTISSPSGAFRITVSIGLVFDYGNDLADMVSRAEKGVAMAKNQGRNRVVSPS